MRLADGGVTGRGLGVSLPSETCSRPHVVRDVGCQHLVQPSSVQHDHLIEALAPDRADDAMTRAYFGMTFNLNRNKAYRVSSNHSVCRARSLWRIFNRPKRYGFAP
jgi:hypothetical protein